MLTVQSSLAHIYKKHQVLFFFFLLKSHLKFQCTAYMTVEEVEALFPKTGISVRRI